MVLEIVLLIFFYQNSLIFGNKKNAFIRWNYIKMYVQNKNKEITKALENMMQQQQR